jgi:O-antigen/teichoic acid export membrane protein
MGLNLLIKPIFIFGIDRQIQNMAGPENYGLYYAVFSFSLLGSMLLDAGLSNYNARQVAIYPEKALKRTPALLGLRLWLFVVYALLTLSIGWWVGYRGAAWTLLAMVSINQGLNYTLFFLRSNLQGMHLFKRDGALSVLDRALTIGFCIPLLKGYSYSGNLLLDFVLVQTMAYSLSTALALYWNSRFTSLKPAFQPLLQKSLLAQTFPFAVLGLVMTLYSRLDAVMLVNMLPDGIFQAGQYAAGYRLLDAFATVPLLLSGMLLPLFSRQIYQSEKTAPLARFTGLLLLGSGWLLGLMAYFHHEAILRLMYTHNSAEQDRLFVWLMWTYLPIAGIFVFGSLLTAAGKLKLLNWLAVGGLILNVSLNLVLIPSEGAVGAAIATFITQFLLFVAQLWFAARRFYWTFDGRLLIKIGFFMLLSGAFMYFTRTGDGWWGMLSGLALGAASLVLLFAERWKQFREMVR